MNNKTEHAGKIMKQFYRFEISKYNDDFLNRVLEKRVIQSNEPSFESYCKRLIDDRLEAERFINSLQITYSEFFRNPLTFSCLEQIILPALIEKKKKEGQKEIRIWVAACASGQEAYSVAMLCDELQNNANHNISFRIFASDINPVEIESATKGSYPISMLGNVSLKRLKKYFHKAGDHYKIIPKLKELIDFSHFDLLNEQSGCPPSSIFGNFDILFCVNLLYYYKPEYQKKILKRFHQCLAAGSHLIVSEPDSSQVSHCGFRNVTLSTAIYQKKI
jgi:chemotaxis protein methyltransferase CheR